MPQQEVFFEDRVGERRIEVLKSYDQAYARKAFQNMDEEALRQLWKALKSEETYDPAGLPREDGSQLSFFIVNEGQGRHNDSLFVSSDWPSAEAFAQLRLASYNG